MFVSSGRKNAAPLTDILTDDKQQTVHCQCPPLNENKIRGNAGEPNAIKP
jgi:hypothetical protein